MAPATTHPALPSSSSLSQFNRSLEYLLSSLPLFLFLWSPSSAHQHHSIQLHSHQPTNKTLCCCPACLPVPLLVRSHSIITPRSSAAIISLFAAPAFIPQHTQSQSQPRLKTAVSPGDGDALASPRSAPPRTHLTPSPLPTMYPFLLTATLSAPCLAHTTRARGATTTTLCPSAENERPNKKKCNTHSIASHSTHPIH